MKLASSSASFDAALAAGDADPTRVARPVRARVASSTAIVFEARHFPRTDDDYLAQLKKLAADLGLTVAALACDVLARGGRRRDGRVAPRPGWRSRGRSARRCSSRGVPAAAEATRPAGTTSSRRAKAAALDAKRSNVVLARPQRAGDALRERRRPQATQQGGRQFVAALRVDAAALDPPEPVAPLLARDGRRAPRDGGDRGGRSPRWAAFAGSSWSTGVAGPGAATPAIAARDALARHRARPKGKSGTGVNRFRSTTKTTLAVCRPGLNLLI